MMRKLIFGIFISSSTVGLYSGDTLSIYEITSYKSSEYLSGILEKFPSTIFSANFRWLDAVNGGDRFTSSYMTQPSDQMSVFSS